MKAQEDIGDRLRQFATSEFGSLKALADALNIPQSNLSSYLNGQRRPGVAMQGKLRDLGCDIEWLMTGKKSEQARGDPATEEMIAVLKKAGITSPKQLRDLLDQHEQLRRSLGPAAYQTVLEIARVAEHRGKYGGRKRRKKPGGL